MLKWRVGLRIWTVYPFYISKDVICVPSADTDRLLDLLAE